jgi:hypothetical protein
MKRAERARMWAKYVAGWESSGLTQQRYCESKAISYDTFKRWRLRLRRQAASGASKLRLVPVEVMSAPAVRAEPMSTARRSAEAVRVWGVEVRLASGRGLVLAGEFDEVALARLVRMLEVLPC